MTNPDEQIKDDKRRDKQNDGEGKTVEPGGSKAPGDRDESAYPNDDYWEKGKGGKSRVPADENPEPDNGYRWES